MVDLNLDPKLLAKLELQHQDRATKVAKVWRDGLSHKDWLFDGHAITGKVMLARWNNLDWSKAWMDLGPSVSGNLGPYWHVPLKETWVDGELYDCGDTTHRLYPKVLQSKWAMLVLHACYETHKKAVMPIGNGQSQIPPTK